MKISKFDRLNLNDIDKRTLTFLTDMPFVEPEAIQIDITNKCNLKCIYCWNNSPFLKKNHPAEWFNKKIDFEYFKKILDNLAKNTNTIILGGEGELFTHKDIMKMIEYVKVAGKKLIIITNGTLINKSKIKKLVDLYVDELIINISAATSKTYKKMHLNEQYTTFNKLKSWLIYLKKIKEEKLFVKPRIKIVNVITKLNYLEILKMIKFSVEIGADELRFKPVQSKQKSTDFLVLEKKEVEKLKNMLKNSKTFIKKYDIRNNLNEFYIKLLNEKYAKVGFYTKNLAKDVGCFSSWHFGRFLIEKSYTPCCNVPIEISIENCNRFEEIWKDEKFTNFRDNVKKMNLEKKLVYKNCKELCPHFIRNSTLLKEMKKSFDKVKTDNNLQFLYKNYSENSSAILEKKLKILFHTINGAGLGHLNRAIVLAKSLQIKEPMADIRIATESKFTKMLDNSNFRYYKLPYSHIDESKYNSNLIKNENEKVMKAIINEFKPDIIIYDTQPFEEILYDKCSDNIKNVLILRKFDDVILKKFLQRSILDKFDLIIFPHDKKEFKDLNVVKNIIKKTKFVGPIIREINPHAINKVKNQYKITSKKFNILVIGGGGGEDEYNKGTRLFYKIIKDVSSFVKKKFKKINFIVITGPLFKGELNIKNVIIKKFEPNLIELMKSVDLIISIAGYNMCNEIYKVRTPAIIIPFQRFRENQKERAEFFAKSGAMLHMSKINKIELSKIIFNLYKNRSKLNKMKSSFNKINLTIGNEEAAKEILKLSLSNEIKRHFITYDAILKYDFQKFDEIKKITIVIPTYNRKELLKKTLISLFNQKYPKDKYEVIVVDDGSNDDTEEMIRSLKPTCNFKYFYWPRKEKFELGEPKNRVAAVRNIGIENARGEIILFVDSDMILDKNCVRRHVLMHKKHKNTVIIGYRNLLFKQKNPLNLVLNKKVPFQDDFREILLLIHKDELWRLLHSNNVSIKKDNLIEVGMFEDGLINKYWGIEDQELGYRLFKAGFSFKMDKKAVGYHQYHDPEYINHYLMRLGLKKNWEFLYKLHPSEEIYNRFISYYSKYDYELLFVGKTCNNECSVCSILAHKSTKNKSTDQIKHEMIKLRKKSESILISGGEPAIRPDIVDIISYAKSLNFKKIALETNGRMFFYKDFCKKIIMAGVNKFFVYIHGSNANIHESITNTKKSFKQTLTGIRNLANMNQNIEARVPVIKENYKNLLEIFILLNNCGVKSVEFLVPRMPKKSGLIPKYIHIAKEIKKVLNYEKEEGAKAYAKIYFM
jgi:MoaA/NifB/PqqE/SkfB family radical SAM enzyme/predicted glycosyltransferase